MAILNPLEHTLDELGTSEFWASVSDLQRGCTPLCIILPSGRAIEATSGHLALISDALYTHEVVLEIDHLSQESQTDGVETRSMLDIDFNEAYRSATTSPNEETEWILNANLLLLATADVNLATRLLLEKTGAFDRYHMGYKPPYEDCIIVGAQGNTYVVQAHPNVGVLAMYGVPWTEQPRVAILSGGILAPGTLAATLLLLRYLRGDRQGNNSFRIGVPLRIVSSALRDYRHTELLESTKCLPAHEMRNIRSHLLIHE